MSFLDDASAPLAVTATAAVNTASTATVPLVAGNFHYLVLVELVKYLSVVGVAAAAPVVVTSTNLPGALAWTTRQAVDAAGTAFSVIYWQPCVPFKSLAAGVNTTFVAPAQLQTIWRWNILYYVGP
jgi:hypothetical protein